VLTSVVAPLALALVLVLALRDDLTTPYEDYPSWLLLSFGWLLVVALPLVGFVLARMPWRAGTHLDGPPPGSDPAGPLHQTSVAGQTAGNRLTSGYDDGGQQ
jgi:NSS family neurotransmitter:Na+ symporter